MKAFILAAGIGARLRPLTDRVPKCLLPIGGEPLLGIWLKQCKANGITDVLINLHHLPQMVEEYVKNNPFGVNVETFHEERLLGSAGTVRRKRGFVKGEGHFFIIYGDVLNRMNLLDMFRFHKNGGGVLTMALFRSNAPRECGIAELDEKNVITKFTEKPFNPATNLANAGIYVASEKIFDYIPQRERMDFGYDVLPSLVGNMRGYVIDGYHIDIGNPENYRRANIEWRGQRRMRDDKRPCKDISRRKEEVA